MSRKRFYDSSTNDLFMVIGADSTQDPWELREVRFNLSTGASTGTESYAPPRPQKGGGGCCKVAGGNLDSRI